MGTVGQNPFEAAAAANALSHPAEEYVNDEKLEVAWAIQAYDNAEIHFDIITSVDPKFLKLCPMDDEIYQHFRSKFSDMEIGILDDADLKSAGAKERWRIFSDEYKGLDNFNFGTLIRIDCKKGYNEHNTIFGWRVQFLAIEIARNREGYNNDIFLEARRESKRATHTMESD